MSRSSLPDVQVAPASRQCCGAGQRGAARFGPAFAVAAVLTLGAVMALGLALASDPVVLARLGGRLQVTREGAEFHSSHGLILQAGLHDCGPAALANLLVELGLDPPPLDSLARLAGTRPSGTRVSGLVRAAETAGVSLARWAGVSWSGPSEGSAARSSRNAGPFPIPSIAWVRESHFVTVASRAADGHLTILDPLVGRYSMTAADFRRIWLGEVLLVPQEDPPLVATTVAAPFPLAGGFHAKSVHSSAHIVPRHRIRDAPSPSRT